MPTLATIIQHSFGNSSQKIREEKEIQESKLQKK